MALSERFPKNEQGPASSVNIVSCPENVFSLFGFEFGAEPLRGGARGPFLWL
jgi:hypothetical protein